MNIHPLFKTNSLKSGLCLAAAFLATNVFAGYVYEFTQSGDGQKEEPKLFVEGSKIKLTGFGDDSGDMVFDGEADALTLIDHERKRFTQIDKEAIEKLGAQLNEAMAQMEAQLAQVPPAQRAMMEQMLKGRMPASKPKAPDPVVTRTKETDTINGFKAEKVEVEAHDGSRRELWIAPWDELEGSAEVAGAFGEMTALFEEMLATFSQSPMGSMIGDSFKNQWLQQIHELQGFPVRSREYRASGKLVSETTLQKIEEHDFEKADFRAPKVYKRQKIDG